jgi:hypothetical protein
MYKSGKRNLSLLLIGMSMLVICFIALRYSATGASRITQNVFPQNNQSPQITNKTGAFQVIETVQDSDAYIFSIRNDYKKAINGYSVSMGDGRSSQDNDLTIGDRIIASGAIEKVQISVSNLQVGSMNSASQVPNLIVLAVMFEDGTSDGDPRTIARLANRRLGKTIQFSRILPALDAVLSSTNRKFPSALKQLKEQVSLLPEEPDSSLPPDAKSGLVSAKQDLQTEIERLVEADTTNPDVSRQNTSRNS